MNQEDRRSQGQSGFQRNPQAARELGPAVLAGVIPNPKGKILDQVREVMRLKHYSWRTERCYCDWIKRYFRFHGMRCREDLAPGAPKVETFLSHLMGSV